MKAYGIGYPHPILDIQRFGKGVASAGEGCCAGVRGVDGSGGWGGGLAPEGDSFFQAGLGDQVEGEPPEFSRGIPARSEVLDATAEVVFGEADSKADEAVGVADVALRDPSSLVDHELDRGVTTPVLVVVAVSDGRQALTVLFDEALGARVAGPECQARSSLPPHVPWS